MTRTRFDRRDTIGQFSLGQAIVKVTGHPEMLWLKRLDRTSPRSGQKRDSFVFPYLSSGRDHHCHQNV